ncbi:SDR family oxidoreductase [Alcaligenaceae bacterium]|nr:SDR family oxidoreductase [Alcaligenaceae bacterium]
MNHPGTGSGRLANKVAIIMGAGCVGPGWGNGRAIAVRFAQEGAIVIAVDKNPDSLPDTLDMAGECRHRIETRICDVTNSGQVQKLVQEVFDSHGKIDILVNNVGAPVSGGAVRLSEDDWHKQLDINLSSVFITCKQVLPVMEKQGYGAIVNVSSTSGIRWTGAAQIGYAAAKAGVIQYGKVAAVEFGKQGIRINTVLPGQLHTPLVDAFLAKQQTSGDVEALLQTRQKRIPLPFMGDGTDTANAVLFLASDEARFITGTELVIDGGMSARCD